jgi:hypothetical protein
MIVAVYVIWSHDQWSLSHMTDKASVVLHIQSLTNTV